jgi:hypothetical protein
MKPKMHPESNINGFRERISFDGLVGIAKRIEYVTLAGRTECVLFEYSQCNICGISMKAGKLPVNVELVSYTHTDKIEQRETHACYAATQAI